MSSAVSLNWWSVFRLKLLSDADILCNLGTSSPGSLRECGVMGILPECGTATKKMLCHNLIRMIPFVTVLGKRSAYGS